jgi:hypothetical protein
MSGVATPEASRSESPLANRQALRFVLDHRLGRLVSTDPISEEPHVTPIHYVPEMPGGGSGRGAALLTILPADAPLLAAIRAGAPVMLSVPSRKSGLPPLLADEADVPVTHVQAEVAVELLHDPADIERVLRRQIASVLAPLPQEDKSDPLPRAGRGELVKLVGLRLSILNLHSRVHPAYADRLRP